LFKFRLEGSLEEYGATALSPQLDVSDKPVERHQVKAMRKLFTLLSVRLDLLPKWRRTQPRQRNKAGKLRHRIRGHGSAAGDMFEGR
jgi:hypothetical protein